MNHPPPCIAAALTIACCVALSSAPASADGKVSLYASRMEPATVDAERFSRTSWGGGIDVVLPFSETRNFTAFTAGLEITSMLGHSTDIYDPIIRENITQSTSQTYGRFFMGGRLGPHGPGFFRPHVGANLAVVWYGIGTTLEIPNAADPANPIFKTIDSNYKTAFGYDVNAGIDLNMANKFPIEVGMRYLKSYNVPQQLGEGSVSISPSYYQVYFGIGFGFEFMQNASKKGKEIEEREKSGTPEGSPEL
jgi:opacity protein-like surface antigen